MKSSIKRKSIKETLVKIFSVFLIILSTVALTFEVFALGQESSGGSGGTDDGAGGRPCTSGNCYSARQNGAFWVEVEVNGSGNFQSVFGVEGHSAYSTRSADFSSCPTKAYVLVSRLANGGLAGPVDINKVSVGKGNPGAPGTGATKITNGDGGWIPSGARIISNSEAEGLFQKNQDFYNGEPFFQEYYGTNMGWFCKDPEGSTTTTTTTTTPPKWYDGCKATRTREIGDTKTRIAVRNRTLDNVRNYNSDWRSTGGPRASLPNDSGWTDGGGEYYVIAKPGDSIQFLHAYCAGARYVRRTQDQSVHWVSAESHNILFDIPTNHFQIGATPDFYLFGNGISWVNSQAASSPEYGPPDDQYPFPNDPPLDNGMYVSTDRFGLGVLSPTPDNNAYDCNGVSMYAAYGVTYQSNASFQIPGYDSGWSCNAANRTQSNTVGKTITQWHKFNSVKAWEQWTHNRSGSCGCNVHDAVHLGNFFSPEYGKIGSEWGERNKWECGDVCTLCCHWTCDNCCDVYGNCISGSNKWDSWPYIPEDFEMNYQSKSKDYGQQTKVARVYVPYNFETSVSSRLDSGATIFQGAAISSDFNWAVLPRNTGGMLAGFPFATVTPGSTRVQFIEFLYNPNGGNTSGNPMSTADPCGYYSGAEQCKVIDEIGGNQNPQGLYQGKEGSAGYTRAVPDDSEYVGYKYCVAMGFYPSDSHDYQGNNLSQFHTSGYGGAMDAGQLWNVSNASCRTIAKKPNFEVWNGSTYTDGKITTSISKKMVNVSLGNAYNGGSTSIFGSWTDYAIIAKGDVRGMASGAVLGFENSRYDLAGGGRKTSEMNMQRLSPITIANSQGTPGHSGLSAKSSIELNLNRLKSRYSEKARTFSAQDVGSSDVNSGNSQKSIRTADTGMQYAYYSGNEVRLSELTSNIKSYADNNHPNQTTHQSGSGLYKTLGDGINDNTLVIFTTGKLIIDGNICLGSGCHDTANLGSSGMILNDYAPGTSTNSAAKLPQVLIFAKNVEITENVTRIDAWIIAEDGNINTCKDYKIGDNLAAHDAYNRFGGGNCYKTLMINGPVYANSITLNRTAGATHGAGPTNGLDDPRSRQYGATGSGNDGNLGAQTPGEIFNLRADAYLWAYTQAQRYSEAVVTYMRELAPRY